MKAKYTCVDITPVSAILTIRSRREKVDPHPVNTLEANIVILCSADSKDVVFVNIDSIFSSTQLEKEILSLVADPDIELLTVATHTHNSPVLDSTFLKGALFDTEALDFVARSIADGVDELRTSPFEDVDLTIGYAEAVGSVYRRKETWTFMGKRWPPYSKTCSMVADRNRSILRTLSAISARNSSGGLEFILWSWPCHATSCCEDSDLSSDFPGRVRDSLRMEVGDGKRIPIIYLPGLCGDIRPDSSTLFSLNGERIYRPFARQFIYRNRDWTEKFAMKIAQSAIQALREGVGINTLEFCHTSRTEIEVSEIFDGDTDASLTMTRVTSGEFDILLLSAEVCSPYYELFREVVSDTTICSGLAGQVYGYLPADEQIGQGGYEVSRFMTAFDLSGEYKADIQVKVRDKVGQLYSI